MVVSRGPWRRRAVTLIAAGGLTVALEGTVRVLTRLMGACHPVCMTQYDSLLGWRPVANAVAPHRHAPLGFDVTYRLNADGHRGHAYPRAKAPGRYRIVIVGDSNGFGWGVSDDRLVSTLIDDASDTVEVVNLSVSGFGTDQEYLRLMRDGLAYHPDLVVLQVTPNDLDDIQRLVAAGRPKPRFRSSTNGDLTPDNVPVTLAGAVGAASLPLVELRRLQHWLLWHSYVVDWMHDRWPQLTTGTREVPPSRFSAGSIALFLRLVMAMRDASAHAGARFLVVHASRDVATQVRFPPTSLDVLDVSPAFDDARHRSEPPMFDDNLHWTARGHRAVADAIAAVLTRDGALSPRSR